MAAKAQGSKPKMVEIEAPLRVQNKQITPEVNVELFHLLLTFAIRMGFHIGHAELNAGRAADTAQIHLDKFVHAQICMEQIYPYLVER